MAVSPDAEPFIETEWDAAVTASGLDPDEVYLLPVPGTPVDNMPKAATYPPAWLLEEDDFLVDEKLAEANSPEVRSKHRIVVFEDVDDQDPLAVAILAGKLRHELRHAEQRKACGNELFDLDGLLDNVLEWKVRGLGGSFYYTAKPIEMDANAAAAAFLRVRHGEHVGDVLNDDGAGALARSNTLPGPLEDLLAKTVAFLFCVRETADDWAQTEHALTIEAFIQANSRRGLQLWGELCAPW